MFSIYYHFNSCIKLYHVDIWICLVIFLLLSVWALFSSCFSKCGFKKTASAIFWNLLKMQVSGLYPRVTESETLGLAPSNFFLLERVLLLIVMHDKVWEPLNLDNCFSTLALVTCQVVFAVGGGLHIAGRWAASRLLVDVRRNPPPHQVVTTKISPDIAPGPLGRDRIGPSWKLLI